MKDFFKFMFASMLGFFLTIIIIFFILLGLLISAISLTSTKEISISPKTVLLIGFEKPIMDRSPKTPLNIDWGSGKIIGLNEILKNIKKAKDDKNIKGILLDVSVIPAGMSTINEIRNSLLDFKKSGKFILSYSEFYTQPAYYLATVSDKIYLNPQGGMLFKGFNAELMFLKGTLDKLDIRMQVIRHGKFKSATEPFFLDKMSEENREQISALIKNTWNTMILGISETRNISAGDLNRLADSLKLETADDALKYKLVDQLVYKDELIKEMKKLLAVSEKKEINSITLEKYSNVYVSQGIKTEKQGKIAVIYAIGDISGGEGDDQSIGSERLSKAIRKAREDERIKAIVLRINSPGGSAMAADVIWREVDLASKAKPVVASFGNVAASGGYYIACPATRIIAEPSTITGSIGVFALIPNLKGFFNNKLGITFDNTKTNLNADYISLTQPLPPYQASIIQNEIEHFYTTFISHVAAGRHLSKDKVDSIGQGRIWSGIDAKRIGLIDEYGGLQKAVETAAALANLKEYRLIELPEQQDPFEQLFNELMNNARTSILEKELGENITYFRYLKSVQDMKGIQMRLPFEIILN